MSTYSYEVDGSYLDNRVIEHMGLLNAGNTTDTTNENLVKKYQEIDKTIKEGTVIKGMSEMLSSVINEVAQKNQSEMGAMITVSNEMILDNVDLGKGTFRVSASQTSTVTQTMNAQIKQKAESKIMSSISKTMKTQFSKTVNRLKSDESTTDTKENTGTNVGDVIGKDIGGKIVDGAKDILSINAGNTTKTKDLSTDESNLKNKFTLDNSFKIEKNDKISDAIKNKLSKENIAKAVAKTNTGNTVKASNIEAGALDIDNFTQKAAISQVLNGVFDQSTLDDISTIIVAQYGQLVNSMIKSADLKATKDKKVTTSGDIYAAGVAGKQILVAGGKFAKDAGTGLGNAAKGYGEGISKALGGFMKPLIYIAIIGAVAGIIMLIIKMSSKSSDGDGDGDD